MLTFERHPAKMLDRKIKSFRFLKRTVFFILISSACLLAACQNSSQINQVDSLVIEKVFPFYNCIAGSRELADIIKNDSVLAEQRERHFKRIKTALKQCNEVTCLAEAAQWTSEEISAIGLRLKQIFRDNPETGKLLQLLEDADHYIIYETQTDDLFIENVWNDAALGVNHILEIYVKGEKPRYPAIDSISFEADDPVFLEVVRGQLNEIVNQQDRQCLFFLLPLKFSLRALEINERDEAIRYEPLELGMNKSTVERIPSIQWTAFSYSLILVPGQGPEQEGVAIDPMSIQRCRLAAERYRKGLAPLIVVSGGHVHPDKTPYSEAVEMKKYMVSELQIPENAILIEPHARHTTTNMRNTARLAYRFNIPDNMKILTVTDPMQSYYIPRMEQRFMDELGYLPYRNMQILNDEENEFYPVRNALQINPLDPLDP